MTQSNNYPKLHNATWPGVVGKGSLGAEPFIDLDTMIDLTAKAEVNGVKFDGIDVFLFAPHVDIDSSDEDLKRLADKVGEIHSESVTGDVNPQPFRAEKPLDEVTVRKSQNDAGKLG